MLKKPSNGLVFSTFMSVFGFNRRSLNFTFLFVSVFILTNMASAEPRIPESLKDVQLSFAPVVEQAAPAVVNVYATRRVKARRPSLFNDRFFEEFFGRSFGDNFGQRERLENSLGSGVIVSTEGIVVTNNHVISGAEAFKVVLSDRREYSAELLLDDAGTDLAVLKILDAEELFPALPYRNSDTVNVGDFVLAIGNPFGVGQTVTNGIVSALARTSVGVTDFQSFIQTDAPINPGNSGGALVTMDGRLLGVNTAIYTRSGGSVGIGFAIPSNMVQQVVDAALSDGRIVRPWAGMELQKVSQSLAQTLGLAKPVGALIVKLHPYSPLRNAGLKSGDVVRTFNGKEILEPENFRYRMAVAGVGARAEISYLRQGKRNIVNVKLTAPPDVPPRNDTILTGEHIFNTVKVSNLNPAVVDEMGQALKLGLEEKGVIILTIDKRARAARVGLRPGDIVLSINGTEIKSVAELVVLLNKPPEQWNLEIRRAGRIIRTSIR
ncbi:MAG: Do family serine endopeptidase [Candidatus Micropelagos thuwalensis]|nr:Do family serine endopeptidase [Candidatus Micropelagos thuwalensis]